MRQTNYLTHWEHLESLMTILKIIQGKKYFLFFAYVRRIPVLKTKKKSHMT